MQPLVSRRAGNMVARQGDILVSYYRVTINHPIRASKCYVQLNSSYLIYITMCLTAESGIVPSRNGVEQSGLQVVLVSTVLQMQMRIDRTYMY